MRVHLLCYGNATRKWQKRGLTNNYNYLFAQMRKKLYLCALIWQSAEINKSTLYINPTEDRGTGISTHPIRGHKKI